MKQVLNIVAGEMYSQAFGQYFMRSENGREEIFYEGGDTKTRAASTPEATFETSLEALLQEIFDRFEGDIETMLDSAQTLLDGLPDSPCKEKAQAILNKAAEYLAGVGNGDFATMFKALGTALKNVQKGQASVASCGS